MENSFHFFPLWKRGMKGDLTAFQKAKLLLKIYLCKLWGLWLLLGAYPAGSARDKSFSLARFARGHRERRERKKAMLGAAFKGALTLRSLRPLRERNVFMFLFLFG